LTQPPAHQHVDQRDHRARLAGAGGHHEQRLALPIVIERLANPADRPVLVVALNDR
jgi:hypothetical protein